MVSMMLRRRRISLSNAAMTLGFMFFFRVVINATFCFANRLTTADVRYAVSQSGRRALFCRDPDDNALEFIAM